MRRVHEPTRWGPGALVLLIGIGGILVPAQAGAYILDVSVSPSHPVSGEPVTIDIDGRMADCCWVYVGVSCEEQLDEIPAECGGAELLIIETYTTESRDADDAPCCLIELDYEASCTYPTLAPGAYCTWVTDYEQDDGELVNRGSDFVTFEVNEATPTDAVSWTKVKARYGGKE